MNSEELQQIAEKVKKGEMAFGTARQLLECFGYSRRGVWNNHNIRAELDKLGITTFPPFDTTWVDEEFAFKPKDGLQQQPEANAQTQDRQAGDSDKFLRDPTFRVGRLESANKEPHSVSLNAPLAEAVTTMKINDFSQLPVMNGNSLKGMVSWKSIGWHLSQKKDGTEVRHFMEKAHYVLPDESMFKAIELVKQHDAILVQNNGKITGIITTYDLSAEFQLLSEPFLLLAEIENQIRIILSDKLSVTEFQAVKDPNDTGRTISCIDDLTFGEYVRIFQNPDSWGKLQLEIDRNVFTQKLDDIRRIRNEVMHFNPDPIEDKDMLSLRNFSVFLDALKQ